MKTVTDTISDSFREKGSKFIGYLFQAENIEVFEEELAQITSRYPDATHHCYGYRIDPTDLQEFAQDDGEPGGTAGLPILNQLKSYELVNAGLVVVRYYGGTNLGKSGLIEAYGYTARLCIEQATLREIQRTLTIKLNYPYNRQNEVDQLKSDFNLIELDAEYLADVTLDLACPLSKAEDLKGKLDRLAHLNISYDELGEDFVVVGNTESK